MWSIKINKYLTHIILPEGFRRSHEAGCNNIVTRNYRLSDKVSGQLTQKPTHPNKNWSTLPNSWTTHPRFWSTHQTIMDRLPEFLDNSPKYLFT